VIPDSTLCSMEPFTVVLDSYGNLVDYEPLAAWALGGMLSLRTLGKRKALGRRPGGMSPWATGAERIGKSRKDVEAVFRRLGDGLDDLLSANTKCLKQARLSARSSLANANGSTGEPESCLLLAAELCTKVLRFGEQGKESAASVRTDLDELERMSLRILKMETEIQDHMRPAEVVQVLLRIECARLDEVARAPLEALSTEIARTCEKMSKTMEAEFRLVDETHRGVLEMIRHVRSLEQRQRQAESRREELAEEMTELKLMATEQADRDQALSLISASLEQAVSGVIGAMQFQDIVGQRWEHVEHGFEEIASAGESTVEAGAKSMVQSAQLAEANAEMASAVCKIEASLASAGQAEARLGEELAACLGNSRRQQMNLRMHAVVLEVWNMVRSNAEEMEAADKLIAPLVHVAGKMGCQIGDVSNEMRLIALNAQVQAARFGASTGLEVLAEALCQIANQVGLSAESLDRDSRRIEHIASDLRVSFSKIHQNSMQVSEECDRDFPTIVEQLSSQEKTCCEFLNSSVDAIAALSDARERMERSLHKAVAPLEDLAQLAHDCGRFVEEHYQGDSQVEAFLQAQMLEVESSRYTMESEKAVLIQIAGKQGPPLEKSPRGSGADPAVEGLDLF